MVRFKSSKYDMCKYAVIFDRLTALFINGIFHNSYDKGKTIEKW
jgi:hypothetical protein